LAWSQDGATLFLLNYNPTPEGGVYALDLDPFTGLPPEESQFVFLSHHYAGSRMALLPANAGYVVLEGVEADPGSGLTVTLADVNGSVLYQYPVPGDGSIASAVAVSPDGTRMLASYYNLFGAGDKVMLFDVGAGGTLEYAADVDVYDPADLQWSENGAFALALEAEGNKARLLKVSPQDLSIAGTGSTGLPLEIASMKWGSMADLFIVTTVSASTGVSGLRMYIEDAGQLKEHSFFGMGDGLDVLIDSVAIQP